jgi:hypothetical protein
MGSLIRFAAIAMSLVVALGFATFAADELARGSENQQRELANELGNEVTPADAAPPGTVDPTPAEERAREAANGGLREAIDDANDVLLAPFGSLIDSDNAWVRRGIPTILALLLYGVGLGMLANFLPQQRRSSGDWRTA